MLNALNAPVEAASAELDQAQATAAATSARVRLGDLAPDMMRLDAETKQITHAIRMAAGNAETALARAGHYARAEDEACALIREALATSGDIHPGPGQLLVQLDPLTTPGELGPWPRSAGSNQAQAHYPGTDLMLCYEVKPHPGLA